MTDRIFQTFLHRQREEGLALARESDLVGLVPVDEHGSRFVATFSCAGLVEEGPGRIAVANCFAVGIWFPSDYLRRADPFRVLTWLGPRQVFHPNISATAPVICVGRIDPGTSLVDIVYQLFDIITWKKLTVRDDDALNRAACQWARNNPQRYPVDRRPLKRRVLDLHVSHLNSEERVPDGRA